MLRHVCSCESYTAKHNKLIRFCGPEQQIRGSTCASCVRLSHGTDSGYRPTEFCLRTHLYLTAAAAPMRVTEVRQHARL